MEGRLFGVEVFAPLPGFARLPFPVWVRPRILMLSRGACCLEAGPNAASLLIGACLRDLRRRNIGLIVAYADQRAGETGAAYRAAGAVAAGRTSGEWTYTKLRDGRWYSERGLERKMRGRAPRFADVEETVIDVGGRTRWIWRLDPAISLPESWGLAR